MEKQKTNKGIIAIIILLIVIVLALAGGMVYLFLNQSKDNNTTNNTINNTATNNTTNTVINNTVAEVTDELLYSGAYNTVVFIENGNVYLSRTEDGTGVAEGSITTKKVSGITGKVLKIRGYCISNSPEYTYFLVTEQGKVYTVVYEAEAKEETYFKDYNVVDVIGAEKIEDSSYLYAKKYTILTKENKKYQIDVSRKESDTQEKVTVTELK